MEWTIVMEVHIFEVKLDRSFGRTTSNSCRKKHKRTGQKFIQRSETLGKEHTLIYGENQDNSTRQNITSNLFSNNEWPLELWKTGITKKKSKRKYFPTYFLLLSAQYQVVWITLKSSSYYPQFQCIISIVILALRPFHQFEILCKIYFFYCNPLK